jgi:pimeloyl-ACP methyl ester carboxylesterase
MFTETTRSAGSQAFAASTVYSSPLGYHAMQDWYTSTLDRSGLVCTSRTIGTRFGDTHLLAAGHLDAPPVILLHGSEGTALSWRYQFTALSGTMRLYALDVIGSAGKSAPARLPHAGLHYAEWLTDLLDGLQLAHSSFVGISNGSWLIMKLAELAPERINTAVLLSANGLVPVRFPYRLTRWLEITALGRLQEAFSRRLVTCRLVQAALTLATPGGATLDPDEIEWFYLLAKHYRFRFPPPPLADEQLRRLTAPTMLLMGEADPFFSPHAAVLRARAHLPNMRVAEVVAGAGHSMITEKPELINQRLADFLQATH